LSRRRNSYVKQKDQNVLSDWVCPVVGFAPDPAVLRLVAVVFLHVLVAVVEGPCDAVARRRQLERFHLERVVVVLRAVDQQAVVRVLLDALTRKALWRKG
jgi:hypothetical protein